ncbi:MAG: type VI secretion system tube protein Hcp [Roseobacter sp.]|jgi:type VI secretion system secreted protein Hcp|nr:type VI secretion system tube protein Hcp [Roseobacter sp.]
MPLTGYLKIPEIPGESTDTDHTNEIEVFDISWTIEQLQQRTVAPTQVPFAIPGRVRARSVVGPIILRKYYDAASPYLAEAVDLGRTYRSMDISVTRLIESANIDYLTIRMKNVNVISYTMQTNENTAAGGDFVETFSLSFEEADFKYSQLDNRFTVSAEHAVKIEA